MTVISGMLLRRARILTFSTDMRLYARVDPSVKCLSVIFATGDALLLSAIPYQPIRGWRVFRMAGLLHPVRHPVRPSQVVRHHQAVLAAERGNEPAPGGVGFRGRHQGPVLVPVEMPHSRRGLRHERNALVLGRR